MTTSNRPRTAAAVAVAVAVVALALLALTEPAQAGRATAAIAEFEGSKIDLTQGWGRATACATDGASTHCFRTEGQMDAFLETGAMLLSDCPSSLRLYSSTGFGGSVLNLTARGFWLNLSSYGFDNITSSYSVGACDSTFASGAGGGGSWYPGPTGAGASAGSMLAGWNDVISSVFIS